MNIATIQKTIEKAFKLPSIVVSVSPRCNLSCFFCSQNEYLNKGRYEYNALLDKELIKRLQGVPSYIHLTGGEPLIHSGLENFFRFCAEQGHYISMSTNGVLAHKNLYKILQSLPIEQAVYFHIAHHFYEGISIDYMRRQANIFRELGLPHFIKYIGFPSSFDYIETCMELIQNDGSPTEITSLQTFKKRYNGRNLPAEYSAREMLWFLQRMNLTSFAVQLFDGFLTQGLECKYAGNKFAIYNMLGKEKLIPCCHTSDLAIEWNTTPWGSQKYHQVAPIKCPVYKCTGFNMTLQGIQGLEDEADRLAEFLSGRNMQPGPEFHIKKIMSWRRTLPLCLEHKFELLMDAFYG